MPRSPYRLTESEIQLHVEGLLDANKWMAYWFDDGKGNAFLFDGGFDPRGAWQESVCLASQSDILVIGGVGTGKTVGFGMMACYWAALTHDFKFLDATPTAYQSALMYKAILERARGTRFEKLIWKSPARPYPTIELRFYVGDYLVVSTLEFMSIDKNAQTIFTWEGDWIHVDECGLVDDLSEVITVLGTRLRGSIRGRERLGRLSMSTNPWDNPELWYRWDLANGDPENYLSIVVSSFHNLNVTDKQRDRMLARIPEHDRERFMNGTRPEGRGLYFSSDSVTGCEDAIFSMELNQAQTLKIPGYAMESKSGAGVVYFHTPPKTKRFYMLLGDGGMGDAPNRNAPVLGVFDITNFPSEPARLVAFYWGSGNNSITPFVQQLFTFARQYKPVFAGIDGTSSQRGFAEILNRIVASERIEDDEIINWLGIDPETETLGLPDDFRIEPMDFSGSKKAHYLRSAQIMISARKMSWPHIVSGIRSQLTNYDPLKDKAGEPKIPQDIVAMFAMAAFAIRVYFSIDPNDILDEMDSRASRAEAEQGVFTRDNRIPEGERVTGREVS